VTDRIYTGSVAETLADGRPLGFGDEVSLAGVLPEKPTAKARKEATK
jgi:hypothetical protein